MRIEKRAGKIRPLNLYNNVNSTKIITVFDGFTGFICRERRPRRSSSLILRGLYAAERRGRRSLHDVALNVPH